MRFSVTEGVTLSLTELSADAPFRQMVPNPSVRSGVRFSRQVKLVDEYQYLRPLHVLWLGVPRTTVP